jgi:hypothetical protein
MGPRILPRRHGRRNREIVGGALSGHSRREETPELGRGMVRVRFEWAVATAGERMRMMTTRCLSLSLLVLSACVQLGHPAARDSSPAESFARVVPPQEPGAAVPDQPNQPMQREGQGKAYEETRARLLYFRENIELDRLDVDFDTAPDDKLRNTERDRVGFRAEFGRDAGGFFQVFGEDFRAPRLAAEELDCFGIGGGVAGAPTVGESRQVRFVVPYRFEVDVVYGSESIAGFDEDLVYLEGMFELGFGARLFGVQASSGFQLRSLAGRFDSDNPSSPSNSDPSAISGTNVGGYVELLYKHERVPLMVRLRGLVGDISGLEFSFGFAF